MSVLDLASKCKRNGDGVPVSFSYAKELQIVKEKLACHQHPGEDTWCWVDPLAPKPHIPLRLYDIQLWAQYLVRTLFSALT